MGNPSKLPYICIVCSPKTGNLMTPVLLPAYHRSWVTSSPPKTGLLRDAGDQGMIATLAVFPWPFWTKNLSRLILTASLTLKIGRAPKGKSSSNHPFLRTMVVSGREKIEESFMEPVKFPDFLLTSRLFGYSDQNQRTTWNTSTSGHYITNPNNALLMGNPSNLPYICIV